MSADSPQPGDPQSHQNQSVPGQPGNPSGRVVDVQSANPYVTPIDAEMVQPAHVPHGTGNQEGDGTGGMIPYKNPAALGAYYLGLFSFIPILGLVLALPAFFLGIAGLRARRRNPAVKGSIHAWIGIILGGLFTIIWGLAIASIGTAFL